MSFFIFFTGFSWFLAAIGSLVIGPFVGLDREKMKQESIEFWNKYRFTKPKEFIPLVFFCVSYVFFIFPILYKFAGAILGLIFMVIAQ